MNASPRNALAVREQRLDVYRRAIDWQRVWLSLESEKWRSLAVIPTGDLSSIELVHGLAAVAWQQRGTQIIVADLRAISLPNLSTARAELRKRIDSGERVIIAVPSLDASPTTSTIAKDADKALLCVHLGQSSFVHVRKAAKELGVQRFLGAVLVQKH